MGIKTSQLNPFEKGEHDAKLFMKGGIIYER